MKSGKKKLMFPPGIEPGTFRVLGERDNRYTMETTDGFCGSNIVVKSSQSQPVWGSSTFSMHSHAHTCPPPPPTHTLCCAVLS